jgi:hypothetical protein
MNPLTIGFLFVAASGAPAAESGPISLSLRQPVYRHSLYATQAEQPIVADVHLSEALQSQVAELRGRLLDEQGRELAALKAGVKPADDVRFDGKTSPAGKYWGEVRALDADGRELAPAKTLVSKVPPSPGSEVRIDEHRNIVIDGQPSVQIGWYGAVRLDDPRPDVLALQNIQTATTINYPDKAPVTKLFREHGIRTMVNFGDARRRRARLCGLRQRLLSAGAAAQDRAAAPVARGAIPGTGPGRRTARAASPSHAGGQRLGQPPHGGRFGGPSSSRDADQRAGRATRCRRRPCAVGSAAVAR